MLFGSRRTVVISPYPSSYYTFTSILDDMYTYHGWKTVSLRAAARFVFPFRRVDEIVLNWFDEVNDCSRFRTNGTILLKGILLFYWQCLGIYITIVIHNRFGHNATDFASNNKLRTICCDRASRIVILSEQTADLLKGMDAGRYNNSWKNKIQLIPHPSFARINGRSPVYSAHKAKSFTVLFAGAVTRYKNIEVLLSVARRFEVEGVKVQFVIIGSSRDKGYLSYIQKETAKRTNVQFQNRFVPDDEMPYLIQSSDILFLPYDRTSSLNSGTCVLAYTYGRNTVCPEIGTTQEYPNGLIYTYEYTDKASHIDAAYATLKQAYGDYLHNFDHFSWRERELQKITNSAYSQIELSDKWVR